MREIKNGMRHNNLLSGLVIVAMTSVPALGQSAGTIFFNGTCKVTSARDGSLVGPEIPVRFVSGQNRPENPLRTTIGIHNGYTYEVLSFDLTDKKGRPTKEYALGLSIFGGAQNSVLANSYIEFRGNPPASMMTYDVEHDLVFGCTAKLKQRRKQ